MPDKGRTPTKKRDAKASPPEAVGGLSVTDAVATPASSGDESPSAAPRAAARRRGGGGGKRWIRGYVPEAQQIQVGTDTSELYVEQRMLDPASPVGLKRGMPSPSHEDELRSPQRRWESNSQHGARRDISPRLPSPKQREGSDDDDEAPLVVRASREEPAPQEPAEDDSESDYSEEADDEYGESQWRWHPWFVRAVLVCCGSCPCSERLADSAGLERG